jgi:hypothetical protein
VTTTETRQAVPGLTTVSSVLGHEERIAHLEAQVAELRARITHLYQLDVSLGQTMILQQQQIVGLQRRQPSGLAGIVAGIEQRLKRVEISRQQELLP